MFLLIDNYDSFTYNLFHFLGELGAEIEVRRNDALGVAEALAMNDVATHPAAGGTLVSGVPGAPGTVELAVTGT